MPPRSGLAYSLPFLDPDLDPNHPSHNLPPIPEDPHAPLGKRLRKRLQAEALERALADYTPPHVVRSYEVDKFRNDRHHEVLLLTLSDANYDSDGIPTLLGQARAAFDSRENERDSSASRRIAVENNPFNSIGTHDFRLFATHQLHLGYHRFHLSNNSTYELEPDPLKDDDPSVCWIMEYTEGECFTIRRQIAHILGLYPAVCDPTIEAYDEEIAYRYDKRLHSRCRRRTKRCIRPSHIEIFTPSGVILP